MVLTHSEETGSDGGGLMATEAQVLLTNQHRCWIELPFCDQQKIGSRKMLGSLLFVGEPLDSIIQRLFVDTLYLHAMAAETFEF